MNLFNSLGSNYDLSFALKSLAARNDPSHSAKVRARLENKYGGRAILFYKAREAIFFALKILRLPPGAAVAVTGYTCYAVYKAVIDSGCAVEYLDIAPADLNFSANQLRDKIARNPNIKVLIIQNTLGYPCDSGAILAVCKKHNIAVIEDLAHSAGAVYKDGREAGSVGDFVALSFSQDKIIDGISGGALVVRNKEYQNFEIPEMGKIGRERQIIDRFYPLFTFIIRAIYPFFGLGKIIHGFLKKFNLLSRPMSNLDAIILHDLPHWYCALICEQLEKLESNNAHRKEVARAYAACLNKKVLLKNIVEHIDNSANLRFPILVQERSGIIDYLKKRGIHVSDIWYDAPVAPPRYMPSTNYHHECLESEAVSTTMLNLPTHKNISANQAEKIARAINTWLASSQK